MKTLCLTTICLVLLPLSSGAETAEEKGLSIAQEADRRDTGWVDQTAGLEMILRNQQGDESKREIRLRSMEVKGDGDKSLSIFDTPADVKGTAFLSFTHALKADDQWLYLPALKRVKRISSQNKSGPFMGSEFAYEDISSQEVEKYHYKFLNEEIYDGHNTFVIEQTPTYEHSGYSKLQVWMDKEMYRPLKIDFYDRKGALLKTLTQHDYKLYADHFYRPSKMEMINHVNQKSTILKWSDYKFGNGFTERDFDHNALEAAR